jgi:hypothetical protein
MVPLPGVYLTDCWTRKDLAFEGPSATSAGAMNAMVFAYGALLGCGRHTSENDTRPVDEQRSTKP